MRKPALASRPAQSLPVVFLLFGVSLAAACSAAGSDPTASADAHKPPVVPPDEGSDGGADGGSDGGSDGNADGGPPPSTADANPALVVGPSPLRRLSNGKYLNALHDLFPAQRPTLPALPNDTPVGGFDNAAEVQQPSDVRIARYEAPRTSSRRERPVMQPRSAPSWGAATGARPPRRAPALPGSSRGWAPRSSGDR